MKTLTGRAITFSPGWVLAGFLVVIFAIASPFFITVHNLSNILVQSAAVGLLAMGLTPLIISGNIDLSVASIAGLSACLAIGLLPYGPLVAMAAALIAGLLLGCLNGLIVEFAGINSFIVTLGAMLGTRGLSFLYAGTEPLSGDSPELETLYSVSAGPVPLAVFLFFALAGLIHYFLVFRRSGRELYAIGGDRHSARSAGIPARLRVVSAFMVSGLMASTAGMVMAARLASATPNLGRGYELWAVIAVILGGARLRGGIGTIPGTVGAVLALGILQNGLNLTGVSPFILPAVVGLTLVSAMLIDLRLHPAARFGGE